MCRGVVVPQCFHPYSGTQEPGLKIGDESLVQTAQEDTFIFFLAAVNCYYPLLVADQFEASGFVEMVAGNVKISIAPVLQSTKAVKTEFRTSNGSSNWSRSGLDTTGMRCNYGHARLRSVDDYDFEVGAFLFSSRELCIV